MTKTKRSGKKPVADRCSITEAALIVGGDYQKVRNMILRKVFGEPEYNGTTNRMTVSRAAVVSWKRKRDEKNANSDD